MIPKSGGGETKAYRPLCLLDSIAKLFEQVLLRRIKEVMQERELSERQYGFRSGRSTITALKALGDVVREVKRRPYTHRGVCAMVTLDIKNAFNSASWRAIMNELERREMPHYITDMVGAYLKGRKVKVGKKEIIMTCGVPQGSVLGPILWNIMYDPVLELGYPNGITAIGYADDLALIGVARDGAELQDKLNKALTIAGEWLEAAELELAAHKTELLILVGSRRIRGLRVAVGEHLIEPKPVIKYLGVWVGQEYRFGSHISRTLAKAEIKISSISRLMPNVGGARETARRLLCSAAISQVLYAAPIWAEVLRYAKYRTAINSTQRRMALRIAAGYRTVSGAAAMVISRIIPIHILVKERGVEEVQDNKDAARRQSIALWQEEWQGESRAAWTRRLIPQIAPWYQRKHGQVGYWVCQALTGHGAFGAYLHRFKIRATPACLDCGEENDDAEHTIFRCSKWETARIRARIEVGVELSPEMIANIMLSGLEQWLVVERMITRILTGKDRDDRNMLRPD